VLSFQMPEINFRQGGSLKPTTIRNPLKSVAWFFMYLQ
jgi:hypothetical protein